MRIGIFLSSKGGSPLVVGIERGLAQLGHHVEPFRQGGGYDLVLIFNQCAHTTEYEYPPFPQGDVPIAFIDSAEYGYFKRLPGVVSEHWNAFAPGSMSHDTKNAVEQARLRDYLSGRSFPYFIREFSHHLDYPLPYHPIDYPLYHLSGCDRPPNREEYLRRPFDLFVSWGASHPWRLPITDALRACPVRSEIFVLEQDGAVRMPQAEYFGRTEAAKCSVSYDGYGSGSFRVTEVLVRTLLLQGPLSIVTREPLIDGLTCREYNVESNGETFIGTDIGSVMDRALGDPEGSFEIYERGFEHCMLHLSEAATAEYVLRVVGAHSWDRETPL